MPTTATTPSCWPASTGRSWRCWTSAWKARAASTWPQTLRDAYRIPFIFLSAFSDEATIAQVQALGALAYLVKPLEVGQIVPAVQAAFAGSAWPSRWVVAAPSVAEPKAGALADPVPLAVGVLMHRHSLRAPKPCAACSAWPREQQQTLPAQAERLLAAVEELARSA
jgi:CheY-like chemotaxis protein